MRALGPRRAGLGQAESSSCVAGGAEQPPTKLFQRCTRGHGRSWRFETDQTPSKPSQVVCVCGGELHRPHGHLRGRDAPQWYNRCGSRRQRYRLGLRGGRAGLPLGQRRAGGKGPRAGLKEGTSPLPSLPWPFVPCPFVLRFLGVCLKFQGGVGGYGGKLPKDEGLQ